VRLFCVIIEEKVFMGEQQKVKEEEGTVKWFCWSILVQHNLFD
jgi:hypothetical protein